jgi:hypothetical protein
MLNQHRLLGVPGDVELAAGGLWRRLEDGRIVGPLVSAFDRDQGYPVRAPGMIEPVHLQTSEGVGLGAAGADGHAVGLIGDGRTATSRCGQSGLARRAICGREPES